MQMDLITKQDLVEFRRELLNDLKEFIHKSHSDPGKRWLKNKEIKELLGVSSNTIQRLRISGKLKSVKIGGVHYYEYVDVEKMLGAGTKI